MGFFQTGGMGQNGRVGDQPIGDHRGQSCKNQIMIAGRMFLVDPFGAELLVDHPRQPDRPLLCHQPDAGGQMPQTTPDRQLARL